MLALFPGGRFATQISLQTLSRERVVSISSSRSAEIQELHGDLFPKSNISPISDHKAVFEPRVFFHTTIVFPCKHFESQHIELFFF